MSKDSQEPREFRAACLQIDVQHGDVAANLEAAKKSLANAAADRVELAVLPELWTTSFVPDVTDELLAASLAAEDEIVRLAAEYDMMIVSGGIEKDQGKIFNRAIVVDRGEIIGRYRKIHLFTPYSEQRLLTPGNAPLILDTRFGRLGVIICYDIRFPELVRYYFLQQVEILAVPAQWPEARALHWRTLLQARAIENEFFVLGCNRLGQELSQRTNEAMVFPGDSRIIDPMGEVLAAGAGDPDPLIADIELRKCKTMRRILPIHKDRQPEIYMEIWKDLLPD